MTTIEQPFLTHLQELRTKISIWAFFFVALTCVGYMYRQDILRFLIAPLQQELFYQSPMGGFDFFLKISLLFGFITSLPVLLFQIYNFSFPALPNEIQKNSVLFIVISCCLAGIGMGFAYFILLPATLHFLNQFETNSIHSLISTDSYLTFISRYILGFGFIFQIPLVLFLVNEVKHFSFRSLMHFQKWVILLSFTAAAIITPTSDILNMSLMALPLVALYQFTVLVIVIINRKKSNTQKIKSLNTTSRRNHSQR